MLRVLIALALLLAPLSARADSMSIGGASIAGTLTTQQLYNKSGAIAGSANHTYYDTALPTPGAPVITQGGTAGGTTYLYSVTARGQLGQTISSPLTTTTTGNVTLSGSNYNIVTTAAVTGSTSCDVYTLTAPFTSGNWKYVGNVACGSAINDTGASAQNLGGFPTTANNLVDETAGVSLGQNLLIGGHLAVGGATLGFNPSGTSGQSTFSVAQTATGGGGTVYESDPYMAVMKMTLNPSIDLALSQPWGLAVNVSSLSSSTHKLNAVEGLSATVNINGTQNILQGDAINTGFTLGTGATNVGGDTQYSLFTGVNSANAVGNQTYAMLAYRASVYALGTTGTLTEADGYRVDQNMCGSNGQPITNCYGFQMQAPTATANVTNFEAFRAGDGHLLGSSTSFGFHALGTAFKNLFEGPVGYGHLESTGTRFTVSGCGGSPVAGHSTAGTFSVTTAGACAGAVVTMGDSQTAPTGWACPVSDQTTGNLLRQTASTPTTVTFAGTTAASDVIVFGPCTAF